MAVVETVSCIFLLLVLPSSLWGREVINPDDLYSRELSEPGFKPEDETDTKDELITQAYESSGTHPVSNDHEDSDGTVLTDSDMKLTPAQFETLFGTTYGTKTKRKAYKPEEYSWTDGIIPYEMVRGTFSRSEQYNIKEAMQTWENNTCLKFRPATSADKNRVRLKNGNGCSADLGMRGGLQYLTLGKGCRYRGLYLHETGHTIGLVHEHQLPQRDNYIDIYIQNVKPNERDNFKMYKVDQLNQYGVDYEYHSVMHYGTDAFAINSYYPTIHAKDRSNDKLLGKVLWKGLSFSDVKVVNLMYKCNKHCSPDPNCLEPGYLDKNCKCVCPLGLNCGYGIKECKDKYYNTTKCAAWEKSGQCTSEPEWMYLNCQKTCDMCPPVPALTPSASPTENFTPTPTMAEKTTAAPCFNDQGDATCERLAKKGDCTNRRKRWMKEHCQKTCQVCPGTCINIKDDSYCQRAASKGYCDKKTDFMRKNCFKACLMCDEHRTTGAPTLKHSTRLTGNFTYPPATPTPTPSMAENTTAVPCFNKAKDDKCGRLAKRGDCTDYDAKYWMFKNCQKTCQVCPGTCINLLKDSDCQRFAAVGRCGRQPDFMWKNCIKTCHMCDEDKMGECRDELPTCARWAKGVNCVVSGSTAKNCRKSCGFC